METDSRGRLSSGRRSKGRSGDFAIEFAQFGEGAVGAADGFALGAFHGIAEDAAGAEEEGHGVEVAAKLLLAELGDVFGEGVEVEQLLDVEGFGGCGRVIHGRLLALKHPG